MMLKKRLLEDYKARRRGGLYSKCQLMLAKTSSNIEGYTITERETVDIFSTKDLLSSKDVYSRTKKEELLCGHFDAFNYLLSSIDSRLSIDIIKKLHYKLMVNNFEFKSKGGRAGEFKHNKNTVNNIVTSDPTKVENDLTILLNKYNKIKRPTLKDIASLHYYFECIHPFQDGNGRVGRLIIFRECLKYLDKICIIDDNINIEYKKAFNSGVDGILSILEKSLKQIE